MDKPILEKRFNDKIDVERRVREGSILTRLFIEVQGNNKEIAEKVLENTIFHMLANEDDVDLIYAKFYDIRKDKSQMFFSGVVEVKLLTRDFRTLVNIVMRYGPSAIELIEPYEIRMSMDEMQSLLADVSEIVQAYSSKLLALLKDEERMTVYQRIINPNR
ncbi:MAG: hypothetical protein DRO90_01025 [Candidatus Altiarchaeales archaeon]|nr:MAG: hypothetical protein DRO95_00660 [Candidatus Altiarchaeales archaeon]RLI94574.1 MAG: hypothetical protein DRO94_02585 [Candidatus Altiarchaeales archaeon]RLI95041.1 MAG: hypothetical protein DRO90_01025 [Candidatus Altiarchaeales archaeon]